MKEFSVPNATEQTLACRSLVLVAKNTSEAVDKFVLWMLTAFGAGFTYLLGQQRIQFEQLKIAGLMYVAAALVGVVQHGVATVVANTARVSEEAEKLTDKNVSVDLARFLIIYMDSLSGFSGAAAAWAANKIITGDLVSTGKMMLRIAYWQSVAGLLSAAILVCAACVALSHI
jgi:hypothetical protein